MLDERLKQARSSNSQKVLVTVALAISGGMLAAAVFLFEFKEMSPPQVDRSVKVFEQVLAAPEQKLIPPTVAPPEQVDVEQHRAEFRQKLNQFESSIEPELSLSNLESWAPDFKVNIESRKHEAIAQFAASEYVLALARLNEATQSATRVLEQRDAIYSASYSAALSAYKTDQFELGKIEIEKALNVLPGNEEAKDLNKRLDALPEVLNLIHQANVAQVENNLEKEAALLSEAFAKDPLRTELQNRIEVLVAQIKEKKFQNAISEAQSYLARSQPKKARTAYKEAKKIDPGRSELQTLLSEIEKLQSQLNLKANILEATKLAEKDDWLSAKQIYEAALKEHPTDKNLLDGLKLSTAITDLQTQIDYHVTNAHRLTSPNVKRTANDLSIKGRIFARNSPRLSSSLAQLTEQLEKMNQPQLVRVFSDNQTQVKVKGVGKIGIIKEKTIKLKPGTYHFEGVKAGYKAKVVAVEVAVGEETEVTVICDEPI